MGLSEVQIGVENLPFAQLRPLVRLRLLDLHHHLALGEDSVGRVDDLGSRRPVLRIVRPDADAGAAFDPHLVPVLDEFLGRLGRQPDAVFLVLDFARAADQHGHSPLAGRYK